MDVDEQHKCTTIGEEVEGEGFFLPPDLQLYSEIRPVVYVCCIVLIVFQCFNNILNVPPLINIFMCKLVWPCSFIHTIAVWVEMWHQFMPP